ncbi:EAL domain-containing protein [Neptunomonas phycophila]|uniref:EAL domain-containing protein n=1 Tax=Neptunomonas phycophila TaxID=1572645 RepID=A0ABT9EUE3_9GAMM|nr:MULTISPECIES: EAL domain-containing protein [Neptunomonas]MDN2658749.1 EAL domain-containing protein [Neptunomonas sp. CHC150]MDO6469057.1 EAL domain-containing protein [Neptunomonas phycophila]MDP2522616.1 EAL domain-containing protein [Neptunomonas phycophila]
MKKAVLTLGARLAITVFMLMAITGVGFGIVISALYSVESILETESSEHVSSLTTNSVVSRQIFELSTRVQLLEQTFLYNESILTEEGFNIDEQLQLMRGLSTNDDFKKHMDLFIEDFHRFLGNSLTLNRILQELGHIDVGLGEQIDQLDLLVAEDKVDQLLDKKYTYITDHIDLMNMLRESYLEVGKMVGAIRSRITPETEKVVILEVLKELDIFRLHLANLEASNEAIAQDKRQLSRALAKYTAVLRKLRANLDQRWIVMESLLDSQNQLLSFVETTEYQVQESALSLKERLEQDIGDLRFVVLVTALVAVIFGVVFISLMVKRHIRRPLDALIDGFYQLESSEFNQRISLNRTDEWNTIEKAFNQMASRLEEIYRQLNNEKKNFNYLAHHDPLTGMANRLYINQQLDSVIAHSRKQGKPFTLLYLDVDQFKNINDSLGHGAGDQLLKEVSDRLLDVIGANGHVARLGGDEFMVLFPNVQSIKAVSVFAEAINRALRKAFTLEGEPIYVTSSIGVCQYPEHGDNVETLVRNADTAMYYAKRQGRDQFCVYTDAMTHEAHDLIYKSAGIRRALENDEFELLFQPQFDIVAPTIIGAEALIRWNHPELGQLSPDAFLDVAEQTGLILDIDDWVFKQVAALVSEWKSQGFNLDGISFSVNFSGRKFFEPGLGKQLDDVIAMYDCSATQLVLEITERDMMSRFDLSAATIKDLRKRGYRVSIDDFGTGYSSLASLKNLPADTIKLDRSFILDIVTSDRDLAIVKSVMTLAEELGLSVVAEGVETQDQVDSLISIDCQYAQGYHFAYPLREDQWMLLLSAYNNALPRTS